MKVLLQVKHPRQEKSPTTRHAPNDLARYSSKFITDESTTTSGAPTTREEPNYKTCSQRPCSLFSQADSKGEPDWIDNQIAE